ncbi:MAG: hypothetical protein GYA23_05720 [Methanomicrobiales archaeon]|nr:hypothetical protein [Methanomicrobiales archaeon]
MNKYPQIPELLEQFMEEEGATIRWVTVQELRDRFGLTRYQCNTVSGFLRRLEFGTFGQFPYIVSRIEHGTIAGASHTSSSRYLVQHRSMQRRPQPGFPYPDTVKVKPVSSDCP